MNLKIGQTVFVKKIGNAARYLDQKKAPLEDYVEEATVSKVGRKWFKINSIHDARRFDITTGVVDGGGYTSDFIVYESWQEILDEQETVELKKYLRNAFDWGSRLDLSLTKLRAIKKIIYDCENPDSVVDYRH